MAGSRGRVNASERGPHRRNESSRVDTPYEVKAEPCPQRDSDQRALDAYRLFLQGNQQPA